MTARLSKDQRNHVIGGLKVGSTVNDIAHQFGRSRPTIHYLMNRYNRYEYVRVRANTLSRKWNDVTSLLTDIIVLNGIHYCSSLRGACSKDY